MRDKKQGSEAEIKNAILLAMGSRNDILCWNNATGTARALQHPHQVISYGKKGSSDILGEVGPFGLFFGIEVKTLRGSQRDTQKIFEKAVKKRGGIYIIGRDPDEALHDLLTARVKFCEKWGLEHLVNYETLEVEYEQRRFFSYSWKSFK